MKTLSFNDLVEQEAEKIALETLEAELRKYNLPLPRDPSRHLARIIDAMPQINDLARQRITALQGAQRTALSIVGLAPDQNFTTRLKIPTPTPDPPSPEQDTPNG